MFFLIIQSEVRCTFDQQQLLGLFCFLNGHFAEKSGVSIGYANDNFKRLKEKRLAEMREGSNNGIKELGQILYFGDMDPSGESMDDNIKKSAKYLKVDFPFTFERICLTEEQVTKFGLPKSFHYEMPKDKKGKNKLERDSRAKAFMDRHNGELFQVELDGFPLIAMEEFKKLVRNAVDKYFDQKIREEILAHYSTRKIKNEIREHIINGAKELIVENTTRLLIKKEKEEVGSN